MAENYHFRMALRFFTLFCCLSLFGWSIANVFLANFINKYTMPIYIWFILMSMGFFTYAALMLIIQVKINRKSDAEVKQISLVRCLQFFVFLFVLGLEMYGKCNLIIIL
jgi:hypothetical protein